VIRTAVSANTPPEVFDPATPVPVSQFALARHTFEVTADGLFHSSDGLLRAVVPPEGTMPATYAPGNPSRVLHS